MDCTVKLCNDGKGESRVCFMSGLFDHIYQRYFDALFEGVLWCGRTQLWDYVPEIIAQALFDMHTVVVAVIAGMAVLFLRDGRPAWRADFAMKDDFHPVPAEVSA